MSWRSRVAWTCFIVSQLALITVLCVASWQPITLTRIAGSGSLLAAALVVDRLTAWLTKSQDEVVS